MVVEVSGIEIRSHGYSTILMSNMVATPIAKVYKLNFQFSSQLQWLNGRASVFGTEGCGFESHLEYQCGYQEIPDSNPGRDSSSRWPNGKAPDHGNLIFARLARLFGERASDVAGHGHDVIMSLVAEMDRKRIEAES